MKYYAPCRLRTFSGIKIKPRSIVLVMRILLSHAHRKKRFNIVQIFRLFPQKISMLYDLTGMRPTQLNFSRMTGMLNIIGRNQELK